MHQGGARTSAMAPETRYGIDARRYRKCLSDRVARPINKAPSIPDVTVAATCSAEIGVKPYPPMACFSSSDSLLEETVTPAIGRPS